ncbi:hypothetical protein BKA63DRAFT_270641 [Paraphoma chrysanthemicola]|nr:hypothetical protein BKA63DRAFT_270641 [Paraphoma chrysanthemicola]
MALTLISLRSKLSCAGTGQVCHISDSVCPYRLLDSCPLLYHAFEGGYQDRLQAHIEAPSRSAVIALLRYCYTGSYLPPGAEYAPILLLPHAETYKLAEDFDVPELQLLAHGNFSCQVDFACSLPTPPEDLVDTIRFVYDHLAGTQARLQQGLVHTLLNYCVAVFQYHHLAQNVEFREVVQQIPEFQQDLCRTNMERNFEDECAFEIIQLAIDMLQSQPDNRPTTLASRDLPKEMLFDRPATPTPVRQPAPTLFHLPEALCSVKKEHESCADSAYAPSVRTLVGPSSSILAYRPKDPLVAAGEAIGTESSSEDEGFTLVRRPRPSTIIPSEDVMSSPEMVPVQPVDVLALTGSAYPDDDEWTML